MDSETFSHWAIIEVFGHEKYSGHVTTETIGASSMIKLTVPEFEGDQPLPGFVKFINHASVFSITPVTEEYAVEMAKKLRKHPIEGYEHREIITAMAKKAFDNMKWSEMKALIESKGENTPLFGENNEE